MCTPGLSLHVGGDLGEEVSLSWLTFYTFKILPQLKIGRSHLPILS